MRFHDVVIIGGGQAGLAMSRCLAEAGVDHIVLERDGIGARWPKERNANGRLLTPNWMTRLPGWRFDGNDPDGFMTFAETGDMLVRYAASFGAPVEIGAAVEAVTRLGEHYLVATSAGTCRARAVVIATGYCQSGDVPKIAEGLPGNVDQLSTGQFAGAASLRPGGVLVVGASASGVQVAEELALAGRDVVLAAGSHTRLPRRHHDRDIMWWLDRCGILDEATAGSEAIRRPSLQLSGTKEDRAPDLARLSGLGVTLAGRAISIDASRVVFADDLAMNCAAAERRMVRTIDRIEKWIGPDPILGEFGVFLPPAFLPTGGLLELDLARRGIATVVWATGYRRAYPWLKVPVLDCAGELIQHGGLTRSAGLYAIGLSHMRRRKSAFIDGVGQDARDLTREIVGHLDALARRVA